jgi:hypothetical protein
MVKPALRDSTQFAGARCNDGTPFDFRVRLSPSNSTQWVVYLQGGVYCDDYSFLCSRRTLGLKTTNPSADGALVDSPNEGIFSADSTINPDLHDANQVYAHYCSSDFWAGATTDPRSSSGDPTNGWYFSGHANVDAMFAMLAQRYGLDDANNQLRVLFSGGSAGAFGAHLNAWRVAKALPRTTAAKRLLLFVDAGWMTDWDDPTHRLGSATTPDRDVWHRARAFWAATFDPDCEAAQSDPSSCVMAPNWYAAVAARMPVFIQQCATDKGFCSVHGIPYDNALDPSTIAWTAQVKASFETTNPSWLFSGSPPYHTLAATNDGFQTGPPGEELNKVLGRFLAGDTPEQVTF